MQGLRLVVCLLLVCFALGIRQHKIKKRSASYHHPYYYYSHSYGHLPTYYKPACNTVNQCYDYMLVHTFDGIFERGANATVFIDHYREAGFSTNAMIREGRKAAKFFKEKYGVDATDLPDATYLAPSVKLPNGVTFNFITIPAGLLLTMASNKERVEFYNVPASSVAWNLDFTMDYASTGTFNATIPKGSRAVYGSNLYETCPYETPYNPCDCMLSTKPKGQLFFRFYSNSFISTLQPGPTTVVDYGLEHGKWGHGRMTGLTIVNQATGVTNGREVYVFPESCDPKVKCLARDRIRRFDQGTWVPGGW